MTRDELILLLKNGLSATLNDVREFSEDPDVSVRPEYLKTMAIARTLKAAVSDTALVRLEQETGFTLGASVLPGQRPSGFSCSVSRSGELDIVLSVEENAWKYPVVIVENKRYAAGYSTIEQDAIRCAEFIAAQGTTGSIEVAAVTYLRRETIGLTKAQQDLAGERALDRIKGHAQTLASKFNVSHVHKRFKLDTTAFDTEAEALDEDEDGMPAYLSRTPSTVWGAMEVFFREQSTSRLAKLPT
ncbi:hypothetical protein J2800_000985 [Caulobacter rhizosphaerae]|uniref:Type I restriction enzyme R protein N-terminal domain-containing protein n=1 Tax=Caulobacter rhizosphaerae TaxID=2010972 RepID=A0ABU1MVN9_9CAUL|nr:hypothetical protein [Caulobacter rhizosphaerae]MDR6530249.1 hypothetical protein [Caulobacter rhizosphaerae]